MAGADLVCWWRYFRNEKIHLVVVFVFREERGAPRSAAARRSQTCGEGTSVRLLLPELTAQVPPLQ